MRYFFQKVVKWCHLKKGYLISFNFNKHKTVGVKEIICDGKIIVETVI